MKVVSDQIARWIPGTFHPLGTDGFGRADTRDALRRFFEVDAGHVVVATLAALAREGTVASSVVLDAIERYGIDPDLPDPRVR
jgi:pyruvate dehydrogenase E1 component